MSLYDSYVIHVIMPTIDEELWAYLYNMAHEIYGERKPIEYLCKTILDQLGKAHYLDIRCGVSGPDLLYEDPDIPWHIFFEITNKLVNAKVITRYLDFYDKLKANMGG